MSSLRLSICLALTLSLVAGCASKVRQGVASSPAPVTRPSAPTQYVRLLEAYLADRGLDHPSGTEDAFLQQFRYVGSFIRRPEGTPVHVCVAAVDVPAACVMHGYSEVLFQDDAGRILYRSWPDDMNVCVLRGELRPCEAGSGTPCEGESLLRLEHPGLIELLIKENVEACHWNLIDYANMTVNWQSLKW